MSKKAKFEGYIVIGYKPDGTEIRKYTSAATKSGLERKKNQLRTAYATGELTAKTATVQQYGPKWLAIKAKRSNKTYKMYESILRLHVYPHIGHLKLHQVRQIHIQECIDLLENKPNTADKTYKTLKQLFNHAIINKYASENPVQLIELPSNNPMPKRRLTDIERFALQKADLTSQESVLVLLMLRCGLSPSELAGLRTRYIDIQRKQIRIVGSVDLDMPSGHPDAYRQFGKTSFRWRTLPMPDDLFLALQKYLPEVDDFLFTTRAGLNYTQSAFNRRWERIYQEWNLAAGGSGHTDPKSKRYIVERYAIGDDITSYYLRHEYASDLFESGYTPPEVMHLMGHSTLKMTMEVYAHVNKEKINADRLNKSNGGFTEVSDKTKHNFG